MRDERRGPARLWVGLQVVPISVTVIATQAEARAALAGVWVGEVRGNVVATHADFFEAVHRTTTCPNCLNSRTKASLPPYALGK